MAIKRKIRNEIGIYNSFTNEILVQELKGKEIVYKLEDSSLDKIYHNGDIRFSGSIKPATEDSFHIALEKAEFSSIDSLQYDFKEIKIQKGSLC